MLCLIEGCKKRMPCVDSRYTNSPQPERVRRYVCECGARIDSLEIITRFTAHQPVKKRKR
jgi:hypothetical protein